MRSSLVKLNHFIPLLTDTLPYEVPFLFSNRGFYESLKKSYDEYFNLLSIEKARGKKEQKEDMGIYDFFVGQYFSRTGLEQLKAKIKDASSSKETMTIPYTYDIKKGERGYRQISLIHPFAQVKICDLYKRHKDTILFYCRKSPYSLRYPDRLTSRLVQKHANLLNKIFKEAEEANVADLKEKVVEDHQRIVLSEIPSSYFVSEKYSKLHDFYDSPELLDLEKKFILCSHFDVKRCFDSIYTHSLSWATKGKEYTKKNIKFSLSDVVFEDEFDRLMQFSNYRETNGIPIGSETSRIFAEIIFQRIDLNIQDKITDLSIEERTPVKGKDFEIKRYMDGFFIFSNSQSLSEEIQEICEDCLKEYKMFVNESKSFVQTRPFTTKITSAKQKVSQLLKAHLKSYHEGSLKPDAKPIEHFFSKYINFKSSQEQINNIRAIIHDYDVTFYEIANVCLAIIKTNLLQSLNILQQLKKGALTDEKSAKIKSYLKNIINISFYIFYLSPRSHTCSSIFKISYTILEILKVLGKEDISGEVKQELYSQYLIFCEKVAHLKNERIIEFLDIVLFIEELGASFKLNDERLKKIFKIRKSGKKLKSNLSYFEIVVLLAYIKNDPAFSEIKNHLVEVCELKLSPPGCLRSCESFMLFFDLLKCPYLDKDTKKKILGRLDLNKNKDTVISFIESKMWFFDWDSEETLNLKSVLEIKEAKFIY